MKISFKNIIRFEKREAHYITTHMIITLIIIIYLLFKVLHCFDVLMNFVYCLRSIRILVVFINYRSSRTELFYKKYVLQNFAKLTGKHLYQSLLFNKVAGFKPATSLKRRLWHRCFPVNLTKLLRAPFERTTPGNCV